MVWVRYLYEMPCISNNRSKYIYLHNYKWSNKTTRVWCKSPLTIDVCHICHVVASVRWCWLSRSSSWVRELKEFWKSSHKFRKNSIRSTAVRHLCRPSAVRRAHQSGWRTETSWLHYSLLLRLLTSWHSWINWQILQKNLQIFKE